MTLRSLCIPFKRYWKIHMTCSIHPDPLKMEKSCMGPQETDLSKEWTSWFLAVFERLGWKEENSNIGPQNGISLWGEYVALITQKGYQIQIRNPAISHWQWGYNEVPISWIASNSLFIHIQMRVDWRAFWSDYQSELGSLGQYWNKGPLCWFCKICLSLLLIKLIHCRWHVGVNESVTD